MQFLAPRSTASARRFFALPAELRNRIYGYALGGMELCIVHRFWRLHRFSTVSVETPYNEVPLHRLVGLTLVSRQLYAETKILPFELCTMRAQDFTLEHQVKKLNITQLQAIATIRVCHLVVDGGEIWKLGPAVKLRKGLKRVVVFCCPKILAIEA